VPPFERACHVEMQSNERTAATPRKSVLFSRSKNLWEGGEGRSCAARAALKRITNRKVFTPRHYKERFGLNSGETTYLTGETTYRS